MNEKSKGQPMLPVDQQENESLNQLMAKLDKMAKGQPKQATETIGDDFEVDAEKLQLIEKTEAQMRQLLKLLNVDYDALIRMDDKSVYAKAVQSNPAILEHVKNADNPVFEAVKVALQFKPYADFMSQYGDHPEDILSNIKKEMSAQQGREKQTSKPEVESFESLSFSSVPQGRKSTEKQPSDEMSLMKIFKQ